MLMYETHVFLGPTLDAVTAQSYLNEAHYHPPIQCGDIIRLLRWSPKQIIIIDGLYEQVPAVWHKEIMLALDRGIAVYGAASMGALRAAELHPYGMIGIGSVFQAFHSNALTDDDEVAVLHQDLDHQLLAINDAMVNIRATLAKAHYEKLIGEQVHQVLIAWCKAQFYPNRSLQQAINHHKAEFAEECTQLEQLLSRQGLIDVKRQDAIAVLERVHADLTKKSEPTKSDNCAKIFAMPYTKFIASLVDDVIGTPFPVVQPWFPAIEQELHLLAQHKSNDYNLLMELAGLIKNSYALINSESLLDEPDQYLGYIEKHNLYYPSQLYQFLKQHQVLSPLSSWMLHYTCLGNISKQRINNYLPAAAFYFDYPLGENGCNSELLSWIIFVVLLLHQQLNDEQLTIKRKIFEDHLQEIRFWSRYKQYSVNNLPENTNSKQETKRCLDFILIYMKVIYIHHGLKDFKQGLAETPSYFNWIYDALQLYKLQAEFSLSSAIDALSTDSVSEVLI